MRLEYKFFVHNDYLDALRADLLPYMDVDGHAENRSVREYTVRSVYFDTLKLDHYTEKVEGVRTRKKIRIRGYNQPNDDCVVFLEIKRKYENMIFKDRAPVAYDNLEHLLRNVEVEKYVLSDNGFAGSVFSASKFLFHVRRNLMQPVVLVVYDREAFFCKFGDHLRITFDKGLRCWPKPTLRELFRDQDLVYAVPNYFILEIKFYDGFPKWLQGIVERYGLIRSAVSKYTICVDRLNLARPGRQRHTFLVQSTI